MKKVLCGLLLVLCIAMFAGCAKKDETKSVEAFTNPYQGVGVFGNNKYWIHCPDCDARIEYNEKVNMKQCDNCGLRFNITYTD